MSLKVVRPPETPEAPPERPGAPPKVGCVCNKIAHRV